MKNDFDQEILAKIKNDKISPKPKWKFLLKDYLIWTSGAAALLVGAASVSVIIYVIRNNDWEIYAKVSSGLGEFIFISLPYFWLILLGIFTFAVYYNFKHTKKGYRYPVWIMSATIIFSSIILGGIFYFLGTGEAIDYIISSRAPFYDQLINRNIERWSHPDEGRMAGLVISVTSPEDFLLIDKSRIEWHILAPGVHFQQDIRPEEDRPIRMLGKKTGEQEFTAREFLPVKPGRGFFMHLGGMMENCREGFDHQEKNCPLLREDMRAMHVH